MKRASLFPLAALPAVLAGLLAAGVSRPPTPPGPPPDQVGAAAAGSPPPAAGCSLPQPQPDLTRYYVLTASAEKPAAAPAPAVEKPWTIGLRPIEAPPFLRNRAMIVRLGPNEVRFADESRWAEPVDVAVDRVLRETLEARSDVARVVGVTVNSEAPRDYDVLVRIERCEGARDVHVARLVAAVEIYSVGENPVRVARDLVATEIPGWNGHDFSDLAAKLSAAVDQLAAKIVAMLPEKR